MRDKNGFAMLAVATAALILGGSAALAQSPLKIDGSAQMYEAFLRDGAVLFSQQSGVAATAEAHTSGAGVTAIIENTCDIGAVARKLKLVEKGRAADLTETLVATDALAVYVDASNPVKKLSMADVRRIFSGEVTDWSQIGGAAGAIEVVIPQTKTACSTNFKALAMADANFAATSKITQIANETLPLVAGNPRAVSFISFGALAGRTDLHVVTIDGKAPSDAGYGIIQEFYLVTHGAPRDAVGKFVDFFLSGPGRELIASNGMTPARAGIATAGH